MPCSRSLALASLLAVALLTNGCGDDSSGDVGSGEGAEGAADVLATIGTSLPDGDGPRTCSLLSPHIQKRLNERFDAENCIAAVAHASQQLSGEQAAALADLGDADVQADGETATASGRGADALASVLGVDELSLERVEMHWQVG